MKTLSFIWRLKMLAWKNIWRNRVRSGVILTAIALGLFAGTFLVAFMTGWMLDSAVTEIENHHAYFQIHNKSFTANNDINAVLDRDAVDNELKNCDFADELHVSYRLNLSGMLASAANVSGVSMRAVNVADEKNVSKIWQCIPDTVGDFLPDDARMPIVISQKTAEKLKLRLRSKIVFTFADGSGEMQSLAFRVCGIYKTTSPLLDESKVFVRYEDVAAATGISENAVHEAAIRVKDIETCDKLLPELVAMFPELSVRDWKTLTPMMAISLDYMQYVVFIYIGMFLFALSFGIINTMLMAILERSRELGVLGAIGMTGGRIFSMIMLETVFLTVTGSFAGILLAALVLVPAMKSGINLAHLVGDSFENYGMGSIIYPVLNMKMLVEIIFMVVVASILSAIYPARKALKLKEFRY